jgi:hypothetical protein
MKKTIFAGILAVAVICAGCVSKVSGGSRAGMPFVKDTVEGRYERSVDQVFEASKEVMRKNGTLANESTLYSATNSVKTVVGHINQRAIYIRVEGLEPRITMVQVQARTKGGGADVDLAHEVEKQIALQLVR